MLCLLPRSCRASTWAATPIGEDWADRRDICAASVPAMAPSRRSRKACCPASWPSSTVAARWYHSSPRPTSPRIWIKTLANYSELVSERTGWLLMRWVYTHLVWGSSTACDGKSWWGSMICHFFSASFEKMLNLWRKLKKSNFATFELPTERCVELFVDTIAKKLLT